MNAETGIQGLCYDVSLGKTRIAEQRTIDKGPSMVWSHSVEKNFFRWFGPVHWGEAKTREYAHGDQNPNQGEELVKREP